MSQTMKAVWWTGPGKIELLTDVPVPEVGPGMVKIKNAYAAICATDLHMVSMGVMNSVLPEGGKALGHESSGVIEELGPETERFGLKVGDKIVICPGSPCGQCMNCRSGFPQYCENKYMPGSYAEYSVIPATGVYKIPEDAELMNYAITEPTVCCIRAMDLAPLKYGDRVLLSGAGAIGSIMLDLIRNSGAAQIVVSDPVPEKRENALAMGAHVALDPMDADFIKQCMDLTNGAGFNQVFEMSGVPAAAQPAVEVLAKCGTIVYFAVFPPTYEMPLNLHALYMKEGRIQTVFTNQDIFPRAIRMIPRMQTDKIIGKVFPLNEAMEALEAFKGSKYPKILLRCNEL